MNIHNNPADIAITVNDGIALQPLQPEDNRRRSRSRTRSRNRSGSRSRSSDSGSVSANCEKQ